MDGLRRLLTDLKDFLKGNPAAAVFALFLVLAAITLLVLSLTSSEAPPTAQEFVPVSGPAVFKNSDKLYGALDDAAHFDAIRTDVKAFARQTYDVYRGNDEEVVFIVEDFSLEEDTLRITGKFEAVPGDVTVQVELLNYGKVKTTVSDEDSSSQDVPLPSGNTRDQFIGSLPQETPAFTVSYLETSNTFYIVFKQPPTAALRDEAVRYFQENLKADNLSDYNFSAVGYNASGGVVSVEIVPHAEE